MSKKSTPGPSYDGLKKICQNALSATLFKQLPRAKIRPKFKNFCAHQIANDQTIILSTEKVQKVHSRPKFEQLPRAQIRSKFKNFCAHQIAKDQAILLSPENVQKVNSRPKIWVFEKKFPKNMSLNEGCPL